MHRTVIALVAVAAAVASWGCSDLRQAGETVTDVQPQFTHTADCDLRPVLDAARRYFKPPFQQEVTEKLRAMQSGGCAGESNERLAWEVLATVEHVFHNRLGGAAAEGARLVNGVLHCCIPHGGSFTLDGRVLGDGGLFGVRGVLPQAASALSDTDPVIAREPVQLIFGAEDGGHVVRPAVYAVRPRPPHSWQDVVAGSGVAGTFTDDVTLITGFPAGAGPYAAYELNEAPDIGFQPGTHVDVIVCFMDGAGAPGDPHGPDGNHAFAARMKRNSLLLRTVDDAEAFCGQWVWQNSALRSTATSSYAAEGALSPSRLVASIRSGTVRGATTARLTAVLHGAGRLLLPRPLYARLRDDRTTPALGGGASGFSRFSPTNAGTDGALSFVVSPPDVVAGTATVFPVVLQARSGGGTAMEQVEITLFLNTNFGTPAAIVGSFAGCDGAAAGNAVGCTAEPDGTAAFDISIAKAGGYMLCARGSLDGFSFGEVCSERFHVRN